MPWPARADDGGYPCPPCPPPSAAPPAPPLLPGKGTRRPRQAAAVVFEGSSTTVVSESRQRAGRGARGRRREAQPSWPRAKRASSTYSPPLFERSDRRERSEFGGGPGGGASQGSRCEAPTASAARTGRPADGFAAPGTHARTVADHQLVDRRDGDGDGDGKREASQNSAHPIPLNATPYQPSSTTNPFLRSIGSTRGARPRKAANAAPGSTRLPLA